MNTKLCAAVALCSVVGVGLVAIPLRAAEPVVEDGVPQDSRIGADESVCNIGYIDQVVVSSAFDNQRTTYLIHVDGTGFNHNPVINDKNNRKYIERNGKYYSGIKIDNKDRYAQDISALQAAFLSRSAVRIWNNNGSDESCAGTSNVMAAQICTNPEDCDY